ncbi:MAG: hypothetical protein J6O71_03775 [Lachnospiraceae bacterium]|nr:hypothetical protein [Lachnospiraceae bacterium]
MFSDGRTRFIVSTFFKYVSAYMLKKGIRMDGVYTNQNVYEELLKEGSLADRDSQKAALDFGEKISTEQEKEEKEQERQVKLRKEQERKKGKK